MGNTRGSRQNSPFSINQSSWRRALREGAWVVAGQAVVALSSMVGVRLFTEFLRSSAFGDTQLLVGFVIFARNVFVAPFVNTQLRFHPEYQRKGLGHWFSRRIGYYTRLSSLLFLAGSVAIYGTWSLLTKRPAHPILALLLCVLVLSDTELALLSGRLSAERRQARSALQASGAAALQVVCCALGLWLYAVPAAYIAGQAVATIVTLLMMTRLLPGLPPDTRSAPGNLTDQPLLRVTQYGLPFAALMMIGWINNIGDRYVLRLLKDDAAVGLYAAAYGLGSRPVLMVQSVFGNFARPRLFQAASAGDRPKAQLTFLLWLICVITASAVVTLILWLFGAWISRYLLAAEYRAAAPSILGWVAAAYMAFGVMQVVENGILACGASRSLVFPQATSAIAMIGLDLFLIPREGAVGAAQATLVTFLFQLIILSFYLWRTPFPDSGRAAADSQHEDG